MLQQFFELGLWINISEYSSIWKNLEYNKQFLKNCYINDILVLQNNIHHAEDLAVITR